MSAVARPPEDTRLLTERELLGRLRVCRDTLRSQRRAGLPHVKLGRAVRFFWPDVAEWLRSRTEENVS